MGKSRRKSSRQTPPHPNQYKGPTKPVRPKPFWRRWVWLGTLGTAASAVLAGVLVNVLSTQAQRVVPSPEVLATAAPQLEVDAVSLTPGNLQVNGNDAKLTPFKVDIKLLNTGTGPALINDARLVVQEFVALPRCAGQGYLPTSHSYSSNMPVNPKPGQVIDIPLSQLVQSNGADRFDLLLGAALPSSYLMQNYVYLYRVHLYLTYNVNSKPLDVGQILIDLPVPPDGGEYYWDSYYSTHPQVISDVMPASHLETYKRCAIANSYALHSILSLPSIRPANLAAIPPQLRY